MSAIFLDRQSTIAPPGYNRLLVPPDALAERHHQRELAAPLAPGRSL
jgi:hypothetical protein